MDRDLKVGLSLGILLIGTVGALLFRVPATSKMPELADADSIDRLINEKEFQPYGMEIEQKTGSKSSVANKKGARIADLIEDSDEFPERGNQEHVPGEAYEPIRPDARHNLIADEVLFPLRGREKSEHNPLNSKGKNEPGLVSNQGSNQGGNEKGTHTVVEGDSLSSIAVRYLGRSSGYQAIYEANRDLLESPDSLRIGMQLRIPEQGEASRRTPVQQASATKIEERSEGKSTEEKKENEPGQKPATNSTGVKGVPAKPPFARTKVVKEARTHVVKSGETLEEISKIYYGTSGHVDQIMAANSSVVSHKNSLRVGMLLVIP